MLTDLLIDAKFKSTIEEGRLLISRSGWDGNRYTRGQPSDVDYQRFKATAINLVQRVCGKESAHYQEINRLAESKDTMTNSYFLKDFLGIVESAYNDYTSGFLSEIRYLVRAEVLADFLGQAEMLLNHGYHAAAASLSGAVLEDTLRKLCDKHAISYPKDTKIDALNISLAGKGVYDKLIQKEITAKADLRNTADHGHFDKIRQKDVEDMVRWIQRFASEHLR